MGERHGLPFALRAYADRTGQHRAGHCKHAGDEDHKPVGADRRGEEEYQYEAGQDDRRASAHDHCCQLAQSAPV